MSKYENMSRGALIARLEAVEAGDAQLRAEIARLGRLAVELKEAKDALLNAREFVDEEMELRACAGGGEEAREYADAPRTLLAKIDAALTRLSAAAKEPAS